MNKEREELTHEEIGDLFRQYSGMVYRTLLRATGDADVAEDLLQETFIKAIQRIDRLPDRTHFAVWINTIAHRAAINYLRMKERKEMEEFGRAMSGDVAKGTLPDEVRYWDAVFSRERRTGPVEFELEVIGDVAGVVEEAAGTFISALAEVDVIIDRLQNDREEIGRLKEETRSNISELQRMIAA